MGCCGLVLSGTPSKTGDFMNKGYIEFFKDKDRLTNERCAKILRKEFKLVVNNGRSDIDWKKYE